MQINGSQINEGNTENFDFNKPKNLKGNFKLVPCRKMDDVIKNFSGGKKE